MKPAVATTDKLNQDLVSTLAAILSKTSKGADKEAGSVKEGDKFMEKQIQMDRDAVALRESRLDRMRREGAISIQEQNLEEQNREREALYLDKVQKELDLKIFREKNRIAEQRKEEEHRRHLEILEATNNQSNKEEQMQANNRVINMKAQSSMTINESLVTTFGAKRYRFTYYIFL